MFRPRRLDDQIRIFRSALPGTDHRNDEIGGAEVDFALCVHFGSDETYVERRMSWQVASKRQEVKTRLTRMVRDDNGTDVLGLMVNRKG